jgi:hypothetical protein
MAKESRKIAVEMSWEKVAKMYLKEYGVWLIGENH